MSYSTLGKNRMLDQGLGGAGGAAFISLHSGAPGTTGANELTGGSPPYTRGAVTWAASAGGSMSATVPPPAFQVPAGVPVQYFGLFSLITAGTFYGSFPVGSSVEPAPFVADSTTEALTSELHPFVNGDQVVVIDTTGGNLPTGLAEETIYFVVGATTDTLQLSLTSGGAAINLTVDGAGFLAKIVPAAVQVAQSTYTISTLALSLNR